MHQVEEQSELQLRAAEDREELHLAHALMATRHAGSHGEAQRWRERVRVRYAALRPEHTRVALWRGEVAGAVLIASETMRLGEARLRLGGLGALATAARHQHRGIGHALIADALDYLRRHNYHVAMLFGLPNFYRRHGFAEVIAHPATLLAVEPPRDVATPLPSDESDASDAADALDAGDSLREREGKPGDIRALQRLHDQNDVPLACSLVRSASHITRHWPRWRAVRVLTDAQGKVEGYFIPRLDGHTLVVEEAAISHSGLTAALLAHCRRHAAAQHAATLRVEGPPEHPVVAWLRAHEPHEAVGEGEPGSGGLMTFVNLGEALESMIPEWENRLAQERKLAWRCECTLLVEGAPYRIRTHAGAVDIAAAAGRNRVGLSRETLMHLLTGVTAPEAILGETLRIMTPESRAFFSHLFPRRTPYVWPLDHF